MNTSNNVITVAYDSLRDAGFTVDQVNHILISLQKAGVELRQTKAYPPYRPR